MPSLSQADRLVLGSDLNRSESRCGGPDARVLFIQLGDRCTAIFQVGLCPLWVI